MHLIFRSLTSWPTAPTKARKRSPFKASYNDTLRLLDHELGYLKAQHIVLQVALREADIRLDGMPRADARPSHPGVILSFDSKFGPLSYPCDTFQSWESNLRAIALALECLRTVDRYGVTRRGEQYQGWTALPAPKMSKDEAALLLARVAGNGTAVESLVGNKGDALALTYKAAVWKTHPDRGGDAETFKKVQQAKEILES